MSLDTEMAERPDCKDTEAAHTNLVADEAAPPVPTGEVSSSGEKQHVSSPRDYRFWCIFLALGTMQVLLSLENTVVVTSLPTIVRDLSLGNNYIWATNIFFLAT